MDTRIRVIVKRPEDAFGVPKKIVPSLERLQSIVGGHIEQVSLGDGVVMICNEEGKLKGMEPSFQIADGLGITDVIVGPVIIAGVDGEDLGDIPITYHEWMRMLWKWGN